MAKKFFLLIFILAHLNLFAQDDWKHRIGAGAQLDITGSKDLMLSQMRYNSEIPAFGLMYDLEGSEFCNEVKLAYTSGNMKSKNYDSAPITVFYMGIEHLRRAFTISIFDVSILLGGKIQAFYRDKDLEIKIAGSKGKLDSWDFVSSLNFAFRAEKNINSESQLSVSISTPVISYLARPNYALASYSQDDDGIFNNGKFGILNQYLGFDISAEFSYKQFSIYYILNYDKISYPKTSSTITNSIGIKGWLYL